MSRLADLDCEQVPHRYLMTREAIDGKHRYFVFCKPCWDSTVPAFKQITRKITKVEYAVALVMES